MIKRGRPKGATAYPETAVCIKCRVFRPKRRGFCDRCRPRNRSSKSNMDVTSTTNPAVATSSSACSTAVLRPNTAIAPAVRGQAAQGLEPESRGVKRIKVEEEERATSATATTAADTTAQIRAKRRRTVSAPAPVAAAQPLSTLLTTADRNRNVDVIQAAANGKDPKFDVASSLFYPFATMSSTSAAAHHLAILLPRSDGTAVDIVPLQFLSTAPATATTVSPSPSAFSPSSSSYTSSPASSPAALASTQALMSLASVSALAASHRHATASPASHSSASSPASSPPRRFFPASPQSSPCSSSSSFAAAPFAPSFAQPQQHLQSLLQLHAATAAAAAAASLPTKAATSKAGDLMLPSLGSLALPRPALPPRNHFNLPGYATVPGVQLASFVSGTSGGGLRHQ